MKYLFFIYIALLLLLSYCTLKKHVKQTSLEQATVWKHKRPSDFDQDTSILISKDYSKDSSFLKLTYISIEVDTPRNTWDYTDNIYMKGQDGQYHEVHMLGGADAYFIYTDSTKSRYIYDKRGKYFLTNKEVLTYSELFYNDYFTVFSH